MATWFKDKEKLPRVRLTLKQRTILFWSKVNKNGPLPHKKAVKIHPEIKDTRCWEWMASTRSGYGCFAILQDNKLFIESAHRVSWIFTYGKIQKCKRILHKCDNTLCVRPLHLFKGSQLDNMRDMLAKARHSNCVGEKNGNVKLSDSQVVKIRNLYALGNCTQTSLGKQFGVTHATIGNIVRRRNRKNV